MALPSIDEVLSAIHREGRSAQRERALARQRWFAGLSVPGKEHALLVLETALEGAIYLPRSLAQGDRRAGNGDGVDRRRELAWVAEAMQLASRRVAELLRAPRRRRTTPPPLDPMLPDALGGSGGSRDPRGAAETPEDALRLLGHALDGAESIAQALRGAPTVGNRPFAALLASLARDVGRNPHFCPLQPLEMRGELDRLDGTGPRRALEALTSETGRRVAAKSLLLLARARRLLALAAPGDDGAAQLPGPIVLAAFQHRLRGAVAFFEDRAGDALADGLERELLLVPASELAARAQGFEETTQVLLGLRASLEGIAVSLRLETRPTAALPDGDLAAAVERLDGAVRAAEARLVRTLLGDAGEASGLEDEEDRQKRLRRDAWMFSQVLRGFLAKAGAFTGDADRWAPSASERFVAEFLGHFRALGQPLVDETGYPRREALRGALATLMDTDLLDGPRMERATAACADLREHLLGQVDALGDAPFDRQEAAATLKAYLSG
ncbi:MAG TPA: hypothetical protein RMF84_15455 [Polyangiaceae bacterium LLY-WYZ-14_1]|nr:hypothetical protein [Polyangiaceae bacterium LLY-WYZ-14_1]